MTPGRPRSRVIAVAAIVVVVIALAGGIYAIFQVAQHSSPEYRATEREAVAHYSTAQDKVLSAACEPHVLSNSYPGDYNYHCTLRYADGRTRVVRIHDHAFFVGDPDGNHDYNDYTFYDDSTPSTGGTSRSLDRAERRLKQDERRLRQAAAAK